MAVISPNIRLAYLLGVSSTTIGTSEYLALENNKNARILRRLSSLRSAIMKNQQELETCIDNKENIFETSRLARLGKELEKEDISLQDCIGVPYFKVLIILNGIIEEYVTKTITENDDWPCSYTAVRKIFLMPEGHCTDGVKNGLASLIKYQNEMPEGKYMNWAFGINDGLSYILTKPARFFAELEDCMSSSASMREYEGFIQSDTVMLVDCENTDASKLYAALNNSEKKPKKIVLTDDVNTSEMWRFFKDLAIEKGWPVEYNMIERIRLDKSMVDHAFMIAGAKAYYEGGCRSFITVSSDCDSWALINSLSEARFMVIPEKGRIGMKFLNLLGSRCISTIYIEDIADTGATELRDYAITQRIIRIMNERELRITEHIFGAAKSLITFISPEEAEELKNKICEKLSLVKENDTIKFELVD